MARYNPIKNSFVAGELSQRLEGRDDLKQYFQGMRQTLNGIVLPHGGFMRRSGTLHVAEVKDSADLTILIPFDFSVTESYVIEAGDLYFRFYVDHARLENPPGTPVEVATVYPTATLRDLQWAQEADVLYLVHPNHATYKLQRTSATAFTMTKVAWTDGKAPLQAQNVTTTTITVSGSGPYTLTASAPIFDAGTFDNGRAVRWRDTGASGNEAWFEITSTSSTTVATADLKSGTVALAANDDWQLGMQSDEEGFRAITFHEGRLWFGGAGNSPDRVVGSNSDSFEEFGNDSTVADNAVNRRMVSGEINVVQWLASGDEELLIGTAGAEFREEGADENLLTPAGAVVRPMTKRGSVHLQPQFVGNELHFLQRGGRKLRRGTFDVVSDKRIASDVSILAEHIFDAGYGVQMAYQQNPDSVLWIARSDGGLVGFTIESEQEVIAGHQHEIGGAFAGGKAVVESVASSPHPAIATGDHDHLWLVVKRTINGATKRYVEYVQAPFRPALNSRSSVNERINALKAANFADSAVRVDDPETITGITQANPAVVTITGHPYVNGDQVYLDGVVGMTEVNDMPYLVANKTANNFEITDLDGVGIDATGFTAYSSGGEARLMTDTVTGLTHLEGETVGVLADGGEHPDKTVSSGSITLDRKAARKVVGFRPTYRGETQRFIGGGEAGTDQMSNARIQRVALRLHNSLGLKVGTGPNPSQLEDVTFREGAFEMDRPPPVVTGDREVPVDDEWDTEPTVYFENTTLLPTTVLAIVPRVESNTK